VIDVRDPGEPTLLTRVGDLGPALSEISEERLTCADCGGRRLDCNLVQDHLGLTRFDCETEAVVAATDGRQFYFSVREETAALERWDSRSGRREVLADVGRGFIGGIRPSPDQRAVAFRLFRCGFGCDSDLFLFDARDRRVRFVTDNVGHNLQWSHDSESLYFYSYSEFPSFRAGFCSIHRDEIRSPHAASSP
jgi:hypothetical protein